MPTRRRCVLDISLYRTAIFIQIIKRVHSQKNIIKWRIHMDSNRPTTVCFTGHRPKNIFPDGPYNEVRRKDYQAIVDQVARIVRTLTEQGYTRFISGGAQGFDQLCFWAVYKVSRDHRHIENILYLPFKGQEQRWARGGLFSQHEYHQMMRIASHIQYCSKHIDTRNLREVTHALMFRNKCMVNDSSLVIGQFEDNSWKNPTTKGGTADCLRYAQQMDRTIQIFQ